MSIYKDLLFLHGHVTDSRMLEDVPVRQDRKDAATANARRARVAGAHPAGAAPLRWPGAVRNPRPSCS